MSNIQLGFTKVSGAFIQKEINLRLKIEHKIMQSLYKANNSF